MRDELELRPIVYSFVERADTRPCPAWCWVAQDGTWQHQVEPHRPMSAWHSAAVEPSIVASLYRGRAVGPEAAEPAHVLPATFRTKLIQVGQASPQIHILLEGAHSKTGERKRLSAFELTVPDARELAKVLRYMVEVAAVE